MGRVLGPAQRGRPERAAVGAQRGFGGRGLEEFVLKPEKVAESLRGKQGVQGPVGLDLGQVVQKKAMTGELLDFELVLQTRAEAFFKLRVDEEERAEGAQGLLLHLAVPLQDLGVAVRRGLQRLADALEVQLDLLPPLDLAGQVVEVDVELVDLVEKLPLLLRLLDKRALELLDLDAVDLPGLVEPELRVDLFSSPGGSCKSARSCCSA